MENYNRVKELTEESAKSAGTADQKYEAYMDSMEAATKRLENAWESFTMKLESSKVLRYTSQWLATIVENMDKIVPLMTTLLVTANSSKIISFFTGINGESKFKDFGRKLLGRDGKFVVGKDGTVSYTKGSERSSYIKQILNATENIDKNTRKTAEESGKDGSGDKTEASNGRILGFKEYRAYKSGNIFGNPMNDKEAKEFEEKVFKMGGFAAATAAIGRFAQSKQVGGEGLAALFNRTGQTVQENAGDKIFGIGLSAAGAGVGAFWGPLGSMLGQLLGDSIGDLISFLAHRSELERKQRVQEAKERLAALSDIKTSIQENSSIMNKKSLTSEDYEKLDAYFESLEENVLKYVEGGGNEAKFIKSIIENAGLSDKLGNVDNIYELVKEISGSTGDIREKVQRGIEITVADQNIEDIWGSYEEEIYNNRKVKEKEVQYFETARNGDTETKVFSVDKAKSTEDQIKDTEDEISKIREKYSSSTLESQKNLKKVIEKFENYLKELRSVQSKENDMYDKIRKAYVNSGFLKADIYDFTQYDLQDLTMEGIVQRIADTTERARDVFGRVKDSYRTMIEQMVKSDSRFSSLLKGDSVSIGKLTSAATDLNGVFGELKTTWSNLNKTENELGGLSGDELSKIGTIKSELDKLSEDEKNKLLSELEKLSTYKDDKKALDELNKLLMYQTEDNKKAFEGIAKTILGLKEPIQLEKMVRAADPNRMLSFARAWNMTAKTAESLAKSMPDLTTALGMMTQSEIEEYFSGLRDIIQDIASDSALSAKNIEIILSKYPTLVGSIGKANLYSDAVNLLNKEQIAAMANSTYSTFVGSESVFSDFRSTIGNNEEYAKIIGNASKFDDIISKIALGEITNENFIGDVKNYFNRTLELKYENPVIQSMIELETNELEKQIKIYEEQISAMDKINSQHKKEIELIKARDALENSKKNKVAVYRAGIGWTYEANEDTISSAKENLENLENERTKEQIQMDIDALNVQKNILDNLQKSEQLEDIKKNLESFFGKNGMGGSFAASVSNIVDAFQNQTFTINLQTGSVSYQVASGSGGIQTNTLSLSGYNSDVKASKEEVDRETTKIQNLYSEIATTAADIKDNTKRSLKKENIEKYDKLYDEFKKSQDILREYGAETITLKDDKGNVTNLLDDKSVLNNIGLTKENRATFRVLDGVKVEAKSYSGGMRSKKGLYVDDDQVEEKSISFSGIGSGVTSTLRGYLKDENVQVDSLEKGMWQVMEYGGSYYMVSDKGIYKIDTPEVIEKYDKFTPNATGTTSFEGGTSLINELGTEAIITPEGTITSLPSKTGIIPADITKNLWGLGEIAPTLVAQLKTLSDSSISSNFGNTTYEEGQYIDNLVMNVYPTKDYDMDKLLAEARAKFRLSKHNN